jgi:hypothetical protein
MRRFLTGEVPADGNAFDSGHPMSLRRRASARREPFAALHRRQEP